MNVSPSEAIRRLKKIPGLVEGILDDSYALWLGSGISLSVVPGLGGILAELVLRLLKLMDDDSGNAAEYRACLQSIARAARVPESVILGFGALGPDERQKAEAALAENYPDVLECELVLPTGIKSLHLDILDLPSRYAAASLEPAAEHWLVAALIRERVFTALVTTNWDPLVERAHTAQNGGNPYPLFVVAGSHDEHLCTSGGQVPLFKIHGCAQKAIEDPDLYRPFMIATRSEIGRWLKEDRFRPVRERVQALIRERRTLCVGLSMQDINLQLGFIGEGQWLQRDAIHPPALCFAPELYERVAPVLLKVVYGSLYNSTTRDEITANSSLELYGAPLFAALYLLAIREKLRIIVLAGSLPPAARAIALEAVDQLVVSACRFWETLPAASRWKMFTEQLLYLVSRARSLYLMGKAPLNTRTYQAIAAPSIMALRAERESDPPGLDRLALLWGLLLKGQDLGYWKARLPAKFELEHGHVILEGPTGRQIRGFLCSDPIMPAYGLMEAGIIAEAGVAHLDVLVFYCKGPARIRTTRSPARGLPSSSSLLSDELWFADILESAKNIDDLMESLRGELVPRLVA